MGETLTSAGVSTHISLPERPPVDIMFQDITYRIPQGRKVSKVILRNLSGHFKSGQLTAILGPSGAGKSTLLNVLAGYKCHGTTGSIYINGKPRNLKQFRRISRYIMQEDLLQPSLSVHELMILAADLKLNNSLHKNIKLNAVMEIIDMLRLGKTKDTITNKLSGGERKRLCIALELINNPPVIFLDEPTTGLDDMASSQCISLLKTLSEGGRTIICSVHTPSARLFAMFDNVYIVSEGQCVYRGYGPDVVPFLSSIGPLCPTHYNPADFVIEVCSREYGDFTEKMISAIEDDITISKFESLNGKSNLKSLDEYSYESSGWFQFKTLLFRMWKQMYRNKNYLFLKLFLHAFLGVFLGYIFYDIGNDGSRTIYNFGLWYCTVIFFLYIPLMPALLVFPIEVQLLKREYFNRWYSIKAYFLALTLSTLPLTIILSSMYCISVYIISGQPLEVDRIVKFLSVCILTAFVSESFGLLISSMLSVVNSIFVGPVTSVPLMLLAVNGIGSGEEGVPIVLKIAMYFSYLRYSLEGIITSIMSNRNRLNCPEEEVFCMFADVEYFLKMMGFEGKTVWVDLFALSVILLIFRLICYYLIRQRLSPNKTFRALQVIVRLVKAQFGLSR